MDLPWTSFLVFVFAFFGLESGHAIRCMNCTSASLLPVDGCHEDFTEDFVIDCPSESTHCQVSRYKGAYGGIGLIRYERICTTQAKIECVLVDDEEYDGVMCTYSCDGDGCNAMNIFPNEPEYVAPEPTTTSEPISTTAAPLQCYNCSSEPFDPEDGCLDDIANDFMIECPPDENTCLVTRVVSSFMDTEFINYIRSCSHAVPQICEDMDYGTACYYSCDTAGCNNINVFPGEGEYEPPETTDAPTTHVYDITSDVTKRPLSAKPMTTTSSAMNFWHLQNTIFMFFLSCVCMINLL